MRFLAFAGLRRFTGPLDWVFVDFSTALDVVEQRFDGSSKVLTKKMTLQSCAKECIV